MARPVDPYRVVRYKLEIDGINQAAFSEASIPDITQDPIEYRDGTDTPTVRKIPGLIKHGNLTLKWGITDTMDLYNWSKQVQDGDIEKARKKIAIIVLDQLGKDKSRFEFVDAWPTKYDAPDMNATGNEIAIETLEIAHEGMIRKK